MGADRREGPHGVGALPGHDDRLVGDDDAAAVRDRVDGVNAVRCPRRGRRRVARDGRCRARSGSGRQVPPDSGRAGHDCHSGAGQQGAPGCLGIGRRLIARSLRERRHAVLVRGRTGRRLPAGWRAVRRRRWPTRWWTGRWLPGRRPAATKVADLAGAATPAAAREVLANPVAAPVVRPHPAIRQADREAVPADQRERCLPTGRRCLRTGRWCLPTRRRPGGGGGWKPGRFDHRRWTVARCGPVRSRIGTSSAGRGTWVRLRGSVRRSERRADLLGPAFRRVGRGHGPVSDLRGADATGRDQVAGHHSGTPDWVKYQNAELNQTTTSSPASSPPSTGRAQPGSPRSRSASILAAKTP